ncbi:MAG: 30S ribosome-binding factor RbfA [Deltaproteobacteria bacterium]
MSRSEKVAHEIKKIVSAIIQKDLADPRLGFTTITRVELTDDLRFAHIHYSVLGDDQQWASTGEALAHAGAFIRHSLGAALGLRYVPEIVFKADPSAEYSIRIEQELAEIRRQRENEQEGQVKKERVKRHGARKAHKRPKKRAA